MNKFFIILVFCWVLQVPQGFSQVTISEVGQLPQPISNNAVSGGTFNGTPYLYSFGGIDTSKSYSGINLQCYRINLHTGFSETIPNLPDTLGKIAAGASTIGDTIFIFGGYHVYANGSEKSSIKTHRYHIPTNSFLNDGADIPVAIDDHVQCIWRDSLIYIITGWSDVGNVPDVQIYNPKTNTWFVGTATPNTHYYKSFGASGTIIDDTIYYFGGASGASFGVQNKLRKGFIDPSNPTQIAWSISTPDPDINGYRMASTSIGKDLVWIGGSNVTYNYDGVAYNGSGGVSTSNRILSSDADLISWNEDFYTSIPMDLRGVAQFEDSIIYIAGGMENPQKVIDRVYKIDFRQITTGMVIPSTNEGQYEIYPNPSSGIFNIRNAKLGIADIRIYNRVGQLVLHEKIHSGSDTLNLSDYPPGTYVVKIQTNKSLFTTIILKT